MEATQAIKLELDQSAWDVELLSGVKRVPWDRERQDPTIRVENTVAGKCSFANLEKEGDGGQSSECKTRVESATCDDAVGPNVSKNPRDEKVKVAPGTGVVMGLSSSSRGAAAGSNEVRTLRNTKNG